MGLKGGRGDLPRALVRGPRRGRPDRPGEDHREAGRPGRPLAPDDPAPRAVPRGAPPAVEATVPPTASAVSAPPVVTGVPYRDDTVHRAVAVPAGARRPAVPAGGPGGRARRGRPDPPVGVRPDRRLR
ncbi:hypothetical protein CP979_23135 [Streptomyces filamentosus]|nr:hypothetical protein CP979_23135 [Streptomyces filamentosus]